jgi:cytochrome c peroxidase/putative transposon-encoded protein
MRRRIKLLAIGLFFLPLLIFYSKFVPSSVVNSQSSNLSAPTGVTASDGNYITKVGINWETIRSATVYQIFRNTTNDPASAVSVGVTPDSVFFDTTAVIGQTYFYWVRAENGTTVSSFSQPDQGLRANGTIVGIPPLNPPPMPLGNPVTATKSYLGKVLFWDEQLSSTRTVSCGTCHFANKGGSDARSIVNSARATNPGFDLLFGTSDDVFGSPGVISNNSDGTYNFSATFGFHEQVTGRKSKSYIDAAYPNSLFWDGRATSTFSDPITGAVIIPNGAALESQVLGPPLSTAEMAHGGRNWNDVAARVASSKPLVLSPSMPVALKTWIGSRSYPELFQEAFGTTDVTPARIAMAIASYERTLYSDRTPFDAAAAQITPLTAAEQRGQGVFNQAQCNTCHGGSLFSDNQFHNIGLRPQNEDPGRFNVTGNQADLGRFRTPSLRNVEQRAPYMHNGRFATLEEVVEFYNRGGDFDAPNINRNRIRPRNLSTQQKADLVAFLKRPLTDPRVATATAHFDRPQLYTESNRVPQVFGNGTTGTGGNIPQVVAIEPPLVGNPSFAVGVYNARGGAQAVLVIDSNDPGTGPTIPSSGSFARVTTQISGNGAGSVSLQIPNNNALIGATFIGRWFVTDPNAAGGVAVSQAFRMTIFGEAAKAKHADFDGDGKTDVSVYRPSEGNWYIQQSSNNSSVVTNFGLSGDVITPEDFDGDGKADIAVFRNGTWYILRSRDGFAAIQFGLAGDRPQPGDYDGDGIADLAVWRPSDSVWYVQRSRDGFAATTFGLSTDRPVASDYDGDGKFDYAVYRNGVWYLLRSTAGFTTLQFGIAEDKPVVSDYDGDNKADLAVWRPSSGVWYVLRSSDNAFRAIPFGIASDNPATGDYDGDNRADFVVFRPSEGNWYILQNSNNAVRVTQWGTNGDVSVPSAYVP